jgi:hypothetical protein
LEKIYDQNTPNKLNLEIGYSGKPNMLFSYMGVQDGTYSMAQIGGLSSEEFVEVAEHLGPDANSQKGLKQIIEQIVKDKDKNEYNRTTVERRESMLNIEQDRNEEFQANAERSPRIIESFDGHSLNK